MVFVGFSGYPNMVFEGFSGIPEDSF